MSDVTRILSKIESGDQTASEELLPLVYDELRKLAAARMASERADHTLQATALVHEAYVRLVKGVNQADGWHSRGHFFSAAAEAMRRILVERARQRNRREEISGARLPLEELKDAGIVPDVQLLALNEAMDDLASEHPEAVEVVKLRFFGGLSMQQVAQAMGISLRTAERHWTYARTWLHRELEDPNS